MTTDISIQVAESISLMMAKTMENIFAYNPVLSNTKKTSYTALVPNDIFKGSHFERRFVTPFGNVWEKLAAVMAQNVLGDAQTQFAITGNIGKERLRRINEVINKLEHGEKGKRRPQPDWKNELAYILKGKGVPIPTTVVCDVLAIDKQTGEKFSFEIKSPLPNSDQTKVSKEKLFKLYAMEPRVVSSAFFALPYNPYGKKEDYDWGFAKRWFDMKADPVVLVGDEFWDKLGGEGTYYMFIKEINQLGREYRYRIYREYLGIEPPEGFDLDILV